MTLDGAQTTALGLDPDGADINQFNATLFNQTGLDTSKQHQILLQNHYTTTAPSWLDLDYVILTTGDGNEQ